MRNRGSRVPRFAVLSTLLTVALTACIAPAADSTATPQNLASTAASAIGDSANGSKVKWADKQPNIVTIMADDMRVDDLLFAPHVRRLIGQNGLTFTNAFSPYPLCCPARASFLTGQYAHNHKVYWHERPYGFGAFDDSRTLGSSLSDAGYRTAFIGKYLNGYGPMKSKVTGRVSYTYVPSGWDDWYGAFEDPGIGDFHGGTYFYFDTPYNINGKPTNNRRGEYQTDTLGLFARKVITRNARHKAPFFMYLSFTAPHHGGPRETDDPRSSDITRDDGDAKTFATPARPDWVKGKFDSVITRPPGFRRGGGPAEADISDKPVELRRLTELSSRGKEVLTEVTRQRAEAIYAMDRQVAKVIRTLKKHREWRSTVLMFTSDNGNFLGEHRQRTGKVKPYEPALRVPLVITGPRLRRGELRNDPITTIDLSATILDIAGARAPRPADGMSRLRTLLQGDQGWTVPVITEAIHTTPSSKRADKAFTRGDARTNIGIRTPRYSFTRYDNGEGELYDLSTDPAQMTNRYDDPAYAQVRAELNLLWKQFKDCKAASCRQPLPADLSADPAMLADLTHRYWSRIDKLYGWRR